MLHKLGIIVIIKYMDPLFLRKLRIERQIPTKLIQQELQQPPPEQNGKVPLNQENLPQQVANTKNVQPNEPLSNQKQPTNITTQSERIMQDMRSEMLSPKQLKMNYLASIERSSYVKKMMNLPESLPELLIRLQNPDLAKDVRNIVLQPIPEPDTQKVTENKDGEDSRPKNQTPDEDDKPKTYQRENDGFKDVLKSENDRNQAILRHYNVNTDKVTQDSKPAELKNSQTNIIKGQVEINEDTPIKVNQNENNPIVSERNQTLTDKPIIQQPQPQIAEQTPSQSDKPIVQQPQPQITQQTPPQADKPIIPQPQPQIAEQTPPQADKPIVQQPQQQITEQNQPAKPPIDQPVIGGKIELQDPIQSHTKNSDRIDNHNRHPIDNRHSIRENDKPPIEFRPIDNRIIQDMNKHIADRILPDNRFDPRLNRPEHRDIKPPIHHEHEIGEPKTPEMKQAESAANLYANLSMNDVNNPTITQMRQRLSDDAIELLFTGLINLNDLAQTIKHGGHDARSKLILAMASASRQGVDNSQIASTMKQVSESMAAEENNPSSILKNIIMLYLPWYPLQEGVGFNLSIETIPGAEDFSSLLKVYIQTRNYGNVNGSLVLLTGNVVDMDIQCNDVFPKDDLLDKMKDVTDNHSMQSNISIHELAQMENEIQNQEANVNLSSTYELNPFLLLMAHSFIKNTIIIDSSPVIKQKPIDNV